VFSGFFILGGDIQINCKVGPEGEGNLALNKSHGEIAHGYNNVSKKRVKFKINVPCGIYR